MSDEQTSDAVAPDSNLVPELWVDPPEEELQDQKKDMRSMPGKTSQVRLAQMERQRRAVQLRQMGVTYAEIARQLGYSSANSAYDSVKRALRRSHAEPVKELRQMRYDQLNSWMLRLQPAISEGDIGAINTAMRIAQYQDELMGTPRGGANLTQNIIMIEGDEDTYIRKLQELAGDRLPLIEGHEDDDDEGEEELPPGYLDATAVEADEDEGGFVPRRGEDMDDGEEVSDVR